MYINYKDGVSHINIFYITYIAYVKLHICYYYIYVMTICLIFKTCFKKSLLIILIIIIN